MKTLWRLTENVWPLIANKGNITKYWDEILLLTKYLFSTIISNKFFKNPTMWFFWIFLSLIVEVYLWWKLQASLIFLSGRTCTIGGWLNTFLPHCIYTGAGHIIRISSKSWFISLIPFKKWNMYTFIPHRLIYFKCLFILILMISDN